MVPKKHLQLLTGYVDGELNPRQRKTVLKLLKQSPQARNLLRPLKGSAKRLRNLSQTYLPNDFPLQGMREIVQQGWTVPAAPEPVRPAPAVAVPIPPAKVAREYSGWVLIALAVCLFVGVTFG